MRIYIRGQKVHPDEVTYAALCDPTTLVKHDVDPHIKPSPETEIEWRTGQLNSLNVLSHTLFANRNSPKIEGDAVRAFFFAMGFACGGFSFLVLWYLGGPF